MHELAVLMTFTGGLAGALVLGFVAQQLKLSPIIGYLLAGIAVGPFTPGFVANRAVAEQFAEIGVILLLFGIGLRFHLQELFAVWRVAIPGALIQSTVSTIVLALSLRLFGWSWIPGLILGVAISVASTVVMAHVLGEHHDLHAQIGHIAIGWTVVEDLLTVAALLLLPILFSPSRGVTQSAGSALAIAGLKLILLIVAIVLLGRYVIPWALERVEKTKSRELFTLAVLVLALGVAVGSARIFGVSMALGAFLAGLAVGRSEFGTRAAIDAVPMRDAFAVLFFVSVGMLVNPRSLVQSPLLIGAVLLVVIIVKPLAALVTVRILGVPLTTAVPVGAAFSLVGEFSFILGSVARQLGLLNDMGWNALVAASVISIALNPFIYRHARRYSFIAAKQVPATTPRVPVGQNDCILVGYGPVGRIVHKLLTSRGSSVMVVDLNLETVRKMKAEGITALYGDVLRPGTLEEAGIAGATTFILSADVEDAAEIIRQARLLNHELNILVRCTHLRDAATLKRAGADVVAAGEAEVGVALVEAVTASDNIDSRFAVEQRDTVRRRLYEASSLASPGPRG